MAVFLGVWRHSYALLPAELNSSVVVDIEVTCGLHVRSLLRPELLDLASPASIGSEIMTSLGSGQG